MQISSVDVTSSKQKKVISNINVYNFKDSLLDYKWGTLFKSSNTILELFKKIESKGSQQEYFIGQGLNISKSHFIHKKDIEKLGVNKKLLLPIMTSKDGGPFVLRETIQFIFNPNSSIIDKNEIKKIGYDVCKFTSNRKKPALILPRGLGRYFCSFNDVDSYSASFVEIYTDNIKTKKNIWVFLNSTIGFLIREITGRSNLGGGMLKAEATDLKFFALSHDFKKDNDILDICNKAKKIESTNIRNILNLPLIEAINKIVYDYFEIENDKRKYIDNYFMELVKRRENKARRGGTRNEA